ncbi:MAG: hydroxyacylglutathione hydrolase C-terminal domain-containing protein, partial [Spirulinaceae cyanobacterium]
HEYTLKNLKFALTVDPENPDLKARYQQVQQARQNDQATVPSLLAVEKQTNPFLRWESPTIQAAMGSKDPVQTFGRLRGKKDMF